MKFRTPFLICLALSILILTAAAPAYKLEWVEALPEGVSPEIAAVLDAKGYSLESPDGKLLKLWLAKNLTIKPEFKPSLNVQYPFTTGQLVGLVEVEKKTRYQDFRGQRIRSGVYTLRYGMQPVDGNHLGTSVLSDYLVAIPVDTDTKPETIAKMQDLMQMSAKTTRGTHPAVFSLMTVEKPADKATLEHQEDKELWILNTTIAGKKGDAEVKVPIRLVVVGKTEAE